MSCQTDIPKFNCHFALKEAVQAYHALMVGQTRVRVKHGESEVEYDKRNINALKQYLMSLYQSCPSMEAAAVLGIPQRRSPGVPVHGSFDFPSSCCGPVEPDCSANCGCG
jgi:hypothetical protein